MNREEARKRMNRSRNQDSKEGRNQGTGKEKQSWKNERNESRKEGTIGRK